MTAERVTLEHSGPLRVGPGSAAHEASLITFTLLDELCAEIAHQDAKHGPFTGTRLGRSRLAVACLEDETREAMDAWRADRAPGSGWPHLRAELLQAAAVALRAIRDLPGV